MSPLRLPRLRPQPLSAASRTGHKVHRVGILTSLALGALLSGPAAAAPWLTSPSSDAPNGQVPVTGGGFEPSSAVLLSLTDADGYIVDTRIIDADDTGGFRVDLPMAGYQGLLLSAWDLAADGETPAATAQLVPGGGR